MYPPVRRRNDSHGSGTDSQDNEGKHDYERDPRAWPNYPVPPHPGTTNNHILFTFLRGCRGRDRMVVLQLPMQSVPITTNVVSLNPTRAGCTRYNIM